MVVESEALGERKAYMQVILALTSFLDTALRANHFYWEDGWLDCGAGIWHPYIPALGRAQSVKVAEAHTQTELPDEEPLTLAGGSVAGSGDVDPFQASDPWAPWSHGAGPDAGSWPKAKAKRPRGKRSKMGDRVSSPSAARPAKALPVELIQRDGRRAQRELSEKARRQEAPAWMSLKPAVPVEQLKPMKWELACKVQKEEAASWEKKHFEAMKADERKALMTQAAVVIQAAFRGFAFRSSRPVEALAPPQGPRDAKAKRARKKTRKLEAKTLEENDDRFLDQAAGQAAAEAMALSKSLAEAAVRGNALCDAGHSLASVEAMDSFECSYCSGFVEAGFAALSCPGLGYCSDRLFCADCFAEPSCDYNGPIFLGAEGLPTERERLDDVSVNFEAQFGALMKQSLSAVKRMAREVYLPTAGDTRALVTRLLRSLHGLDPLERDADGCSSGDN